MGNTFSPFSFPQWIFISAEHSSCNTNHMIHAQEFCQGVGHQFKCHPKEKNVHFNLAHLQRIHCHCCPTERPTAILLLPPCLFEAKKYLRSNQTTHGEVRKRSEQIFFHSETDNHETKPPVQSELTHTTTSPVRTLMFIHHTHFFQMLNSIKYEQHI